MGVPVLVLGHSGSGKSTALRNFRSAEITHINVMKKPLPFKGRFVNTVDSDSYDEIFSVLENLKTKIVVIDDAQYLMANEFMRRSSENGYQKFMDIGKNFWSLVNKCATELPFDVTVYFLMHTERADDGTEKVKTIGKLLDEKITVEGMFTIVLKSIVKDGVYSFTTQSNGHDPVKSPLGMFGAYEIPNDLKSVDGTIRAFWELELPFESGIEIAAAHDKALDDNGGTIPTDVPEKPSRRERKKAETATAEPTTTETTDDAPKTYSRRRRDK